MANIKYLYITAVKLDDGSLTVEGRKNDGQLVFGLKGLVDDGLKSWRAKARRYTPSGYIPVFDHIVTSSMKNPV